MAQARRALAGAVAVAFTLATFPADGASAFPVSAVARLSSGSPALAAPALVAPALVAPALAAPVRAASAEKRKAALDRQLARLREDLEGTAADLVEAAVMLRRARLRLGDARQELSVARDQLQAARRRDLELSQRLELARIGADKAKEKLRTSEVVEHQAREQIGRIASETYRAEGISTLSVALEAQSPEQFSNQMAVAGAALRVQNGAISRLEGQQAEGRANRAKLDALEAQIGEFKRLSAIYVRQRRAAEVKADAAEREVTMLVVGRRQALTTIRLRASAERSRLKKLAAEQVKLRKLLAERARKARRHGGGHSQTGRLSYPVNAPVSSSFGWRFHPIFHYRRLHTGTDFAAGCGTPVHAAKSGRVVLAGWGGGYGNRVVIDHGLVNGVGLATTYNHLSRIIKRGGRVQRGQVIAYSGTTGSSTGCHLHFEVLANGNYVNPMNWL
jgi:murein DD-endopeptidase MepM/ murein hydrolase activator NlpD